MNVTRHALLMRAAGTRYQFTQLERRLSDHGTDAPKYQGGSRSFVRLERTVAQETHGTHVALPVREIDARH